LSRPNLLKRESRLCQPVALILASPKKNRLRNPHNTTTANEFHKQPGEKLQNRYYSEIVHNNPHRDTKSTNTAERRRTFDSTSRPGSSNTRPRSQHTKAWQTQEPPASSSTPPPPPGWLHHTTKRRRTTPPLLKTNQQQQPCPPVHLIRLSPHLAMVPSTILNSPASL
jgi:hypothetical protein